jgi:hypothetical protein
MTREIWGGSLAEIPPPRRRRFPKHGPRTVRVELTSWIGYSPGAKHWCAEIKEEHNPLWNSAEQAWQSAWDDKRGKGWQTRLEFAGETARDDALRWIKATLRRRYSDRGKWRIERYYMAPTERAMPHDGD